MDSPEDPRPPLPTTSRLVGRLCGPVVASAQSEGLDGMCVSRSWQQRHAGVLYASDPLSRELDELQQVLGEGPGVTALKQRSPVLVTDLGRTEPHPRWPGFQQEAARVGVAALFAFPVQVGAVGLGLMTVNARRAVGLADPTLRTLIGLTDALALAFLARSAEELAPLLDAAGVGGADGGAVNGHSRLDGVGGVDGERSAREDLLDGATVVTHQAVGMVSVQLACSLEEAMLALRSRAFAEERSVSAVARDVVSRRMRFAGSLGKPGPDGEDGSDPRTGENDG